MTMARKLFPRASSILLVLALVGGSGCSGDGEGSSASAAGSTTNAGSGGTGGSGTTTSGGGGSTAGCASPAGPSCPPGTTCCSGVPYPEEGICASDCNLDSDRALKHDFRPVDRERILEKLATLEISEWSYRRDGHAVRHVGPMAQDFRGAFGLGADAERIHTVDASGVSMSAIQALYEKVRKLESENESLRTTQKDLENRLDRLERSR